MVRVVLVWLLCALLGPIVVVLIVLDAAELLDLVGGGARGNIGAKLLCALSGIALAVAGISRWLVADHAIWGAPIWFWIAAPLGLVLALTGMVALHAEYSART